MAELEYFTVTSAGVGAIQVDYVDAGTDPDEEIVFAFVDFIPREPVGTVHWLDGLTVPRGIQLDTVRGRYSPEDGRLRTIIAGPTDEQQKITATGTPITVTYSGQTTASFANTATPPQVQAALEALSNINVGDIYVSGTIAHEKQTVTIGGGATGGTFTLAMAAAPTEKTGPISRNASASSMQAYLQALSTVGSDGVSVTGPTGGPWVCEFMSGVDIGTMIGDPALLTPSGTVTVTQTQAGSVGTPWTVNFIGALASTNVAQMTATNATVTTVTGGDPLIGVKLVANTPVLELEELVYDVVFTVPDLDPLKEDRKINPFGIVAPTTGGVTVDLADASLHVPPRAG